MSISSPSNVMAGVEEDCRNLIISFVKKTSYEFPDFLSSWHQMKFFNIFRGRSNVFEMKYFMQEILIIAKKLAINTVTEYERIGGVYLLYSLYFKQPLISRIHIRIEHNEYNELLALINSLKEVCPLAVMCFVKLTCYNAFHFVYSEKIFTKEALKRHTSKAICDQKTAIVTHDNKRGEFINCLKVIDFDLESWRSKEAKISEKLSIINKILPDKNFQLQPFLTPKPLPTESPVLTAKRSHKTRVDKGKTKLLKNTLVFGTNDDYVHDEDEEEDEDEERVYLSLPEI